jgi:hypothetical protein
MVLEYLLYSSCGFCSDSAGGWSIGMQWMRSNCGFPYTQKPQAAEGEKLERFDSEKQQARTRPTSSIN